MLHKYETLGSRGRWLMRYDFEIYRISYDDLNNFPSPGVIKN